MHTSCLEQLPAELRLYFGLQNQGAVKFGQKDLAGRRWQVEGLVLKHALLRQMTVLLLVPGVLEGPTVFGYFSFPSGGLALGDAWGRMSRERSKDWPGCERALFSLTQCGVVISAWFAGEVEFSLVAEWRSFDEVGSSFVAVLGPLSPSEFVPHLVSTVVSGLSCRADGKGSCAVSGQ